MDRQSAVPPPPAFKPPPAAPLLPFERPRLLDEYEEVDMMDELLLLYIEDVEADW